MKTRLLVFFAYKLCGYIVSDFNDAVNGILSKDIIAMADSFINFIWSNNEDQKWKPICNIVNNTKKDSFYLNYRIKIGYWAKKLLNL